MSNIPTSAGGNRGQPSATMTVADVWYALFRHKWKVLLLSVLGVVASGVLYVRNKPSYVSEAKLLVRYVVESRTVEALGPDGQVSRPPSTAANIVNSEGEIIQSMDLCRQVAESITPARILASSDSGGSSNLIDAAAMIYNGLKVEIPKLSNVIKVSMTHPDPEIARLALQQLVDFYFKRHAEIHRGLGTMDAILAQQTDQVRMRLVQTDEELRDLRTKAGVLSLEDSKRAITEQMGAIRQMILTAESELAEYQIFSKPTVVPASTNAPAVTNAALIAPSAGVAVSAVNSVTATNEVALSESASEYRKSLVTRIESLRQSESELRERRSNAESGSPQDPQHSYTDQIGKIRQMILTAEAELAGNSKPLQSPVAIATNLPGAARLAAGQDKPLPATTSSSEQATTDLVSSPERFQEYKTLLARLESLHRQELEFRSIFKDENRTLIRVREELAAAEASRRILEKENPSFAAFSDPSSFRPSSSSTVFPLVSSVQGMDPNRVRALEAKLKVLNAQLEKQRQEAAALEQFETSLNQLQRKRELDEKNYRHFAAGLEQTRFDEALGSGKLANISVVQAPSPSLLSAGKRLKISAMALAAGILGGIGLALLIELMLDQSVRRSVQLESTLALPLLFTIPRLRGRAIRKVPQIANGSPQQSRQNGDSSPSIPGWSNGHPLRSHIEALRDRTLMHFEGNPNKPKLIGVTGCRDGAGVTTIACALAAALSETNEGRVLLINLNVASQSLHPFLIGHEACSLVDVVDAGKRETALIGNNLYVASGNTDGPGSSALLPTSIARILPKIKMSDYDYVIFDMPTVNSGSITGKLAGMVDLVFMVVESEKDSQNNLKRACHLLAENNAQFRIVLNKHQQYVPKWLDQDS